MLNIMAVILTAKNRALSSGDAGKRSGVYGVGVNDKLGGLRVAFFMSQK